MTRRHGTNLSHRRFHLWFRPDSATEASDRTTDSTDDVKMQKDESSTRGTVSGRTQKPVLPQVRYHPTIQASTPADGARPKTTKTTETRTSQTQRTGPGHVDNTNRVNLVPAARPHPGGGPDPKLDQKPDQRAASDPDPDRARPRPEQVPLGLGVQVARSVVEQVEVLTRGQRTNEDWFSWRKNRITASVAHRIAHCRFRLKSLALARPVTVQDCGLFIDAQRPWLAASPDGIVTDSGTGKWLLCLEVKCPYKHRERRVEDACRDDNAFCLQIQDEATREPGRPPVYRLKTCHSNFTQIQCQLAVTGLRRADLVVFTTKETAIVPVTFDPELWEETVSRLEEFYREAVLPRLRGASAAWTPEL
ncbi:hypothetical protein F2P81_017751 [Scophthalmus maximus]|uniref:YqaJ viral recombinase domain-containing protein n=1 Tax=Scophthalmus maximus TaxID=52904 RepID=A0A6A4SGK0_SCOMX|nr:hypothetical protein F2P81_017751 [Scophthalmus maximus]